MLPTSHTSHPPSAPMQTELPVDASHGGAPATDKAAAPGKRKRKSEGAARDDGPSEPRRLRRSHEACARCRGKKIKCDSKHPRCTACAAAGVECHQEDRHRQTVIPRGHTERIEHLLAQSEALLKRRIPGFSLDNIDEYVAKEGIDPAELPNVGQAFQAPAPKPYPPPAHMYFPPPPPGYPPVLPSGYPPYGPPPPPMPYNPANLHPVFQQQQPPPTPSGKPAPSLPKLEPAMRGQDPHTNDMSTPAALAKSFGVSPTITNAVNTGGADREDLAVGSGGLSSGRDRAYAEASYRMSWTPPDADSWRSVRVQEVHGSAHPISLVSHAGEPGTAVEVWLPKDRKMVDEIVGVYFSRLNIHRPVFFRRNFQRGLEDLYNEKVTTGLDPGFICSVYLVLALGTLSELNYRWADGDQADQKGHIMPANWPDHNEFFNRALAVKPDLRVSLSSLQALILLHWYLYTERQGRTLWRLVGSMVRLSIELGLHHDPTKQKSTDSTPVFTHEECELRIRLWYVVLVHDRGTSILLGRPLAVRPEDSDVPMPVRKSLPPKASSSKAKRKLDDDNFSEHFELSHPIADIQADIINTLYSPQSAADPAKRGRVLLSNAKRIIRRMAEFRKTLPERYAWFFKGGPLGRADTVGSSPDVRGITEDEGLTLLKLGIARILLLRAVFSARDLGYKERRLALEDAIITSHNIIVMHHGLIHFRDIGFFTSPIPLHIAAMVILYGHMSKCGRLPKHHAIEDVWLALDMLPRFRWRWERKDVKGEHPLIAALAERVMEVPLGSMTGPPGQSMLLPEVEWDTDTDEQQVHSGGSSGNGTPTVASRYPAHPPPMAGPGPTPTPAAYGMQQRNGNGDIRFVEVPREVFYPFYPEANPDVQGDSSNAHVLAMLAAPHDAYGASTMNQAYMEEDRTQWAHQPHHDPHNGVPMHGFLPPSA